MKNRRILALGLAALLLLSVLAGCSGKAPADAYYSNGMEADYAPQATMGASLSKGESTTADSYVNPQQKLIRTVYLNAETEAMDDLLANVEQRVAELGGYVEGREVFNGSSYNSSRTRYANLTIRIPADRMNGFVEAVAEVSNITSNRETAEDVTLDYVATQSRITALETEQERLLELLSKAETMEDILTIEDRLTDVRYELENVASQLKVLDNQVTYATVHLDITEVQEYTPIVEEEPTVWERITEGFGESIEDIAEDVKEFFIWVAVNSPYLLLWALVLTAVFLTARKFTRRKKVRSAPKPDPKEEKTE